MKIHLKISPVMCFLMPGETTPVGVPPRFCLLQAGQRIVQGHPDPRLIFHDTSPRPFSRQTSKTQHDIACWLWGVVFLLPARDCMNSPAKVPFLVLEMLFQSSKCGEFLDHAAENVVDSWGQGSKVVLAAGYRFQSTTSRVKLGDSEPHGGTPKSSNSGYLSMAKPTVWGTLPIFQETTCYQWQNQ